jgi:REP element-mobilizing transposase RayT
MIPRLRLQKLMKLGERKPMADYIHMLMNVPPKLGRAVRIVYVKGKSAIGMHKQLL